MYHMKSLLLSAIILIQPCVHADGWTFSDYVASAAATGAGIGAAVGAYLWLNKLETNGELVSKARALQTEHATLVDDWSSRKYRSEEKDRVRFAQQYMRESYDTTRMQLSNAHDNCVSIRRQLLERIKELSIKNQDATPECKTLILHADSMYRSADAIHNALSYLSLNRPYFKLYDSTRRVENAIDRECSNFHGSDRLASCAHMLKALIVEHEKTMKAYDHAAGSRLCDQANDKHDTLMMLYKRIEAADVTVKRKREEARLEQARLERMREESRLATLQQERDRQTRLDEAKRQEQKNIEAARQARLKTHAQEQEKRNLDEAKRRSLETYNKELEQRAIEYAKQESLKTHAAEEKMRAEYAMRHRNCTRYICYAQDGTLSTRCPVYHKDCPADRCLRGLPLEECKRCRPVSAAHEVRATHDRCRHTICFEQKDAECPAMKAHVRCDSTWCNHYHDSKCPRFHERT